MQTEPNENRPEGDAKKKLTTSDAPNTSFETGAGRENTGFDSPGIASQTLSNEELLDLENTRKNSTTTGETGDGIESGDASRESE